MARWSDGDKGRSGATGTELVDGGEPGTCSQKGRVPRVRGGVGVRIEGPTPCGTEPVETIEVGGRVDKGELIDRCGSGWGRHQVVPEVEIGDAVQDGCHPGRPFRMPAKGVPLRLDRSDHDQHD